MKPLKFLKKNKDLKIKNGNGFHGVLWECEAKWKGNEGNEVTGE